MRVGRILRLWNDCAWHLSSEKELNDTAEVFPQACERSEINIDLSVEVPVDNPIPDKRSGVLDICYCGRVSPIKNLEFVFKVLGALRGQVTYRIFGPLEDPEYVAECERRMAQLPENIRVVFEGPRAFEEIHDIYLEQHVMFMPSKGENFGHSIQESLAAACPVLISDRTPWTGLEEMGLGWDLSLSRPEAFVEVLQGLIDMDTAEYTQYRKRLHECAREHLEQTRLVPGYRDMFARLVASRD